MCLRLGELLELKCVCVILCGKIREVCRFAKGMHAQIFIDTDSGSWDSADGCFDSATVMDSEKDLMDAFEKVVHRDFPNPQRVGCPGREVLVQLAHFPADTQLAHLLEHVRKCAPCFDELKELHKG
jgi:hypothetical protein